MGLYDYVHCEYPIEGVEPGDIFQTKEFDEPYLNHYTITKEGRLLRRDVKYEDRSDPNAKGSSALCGCMTPVPIGETDLNWHGYVHFGNYVAKFTDGNLVSVEVSHD